MNVGETIYVDGCELVITHVRLDRTVQNVTAMILLSDPLSYTKERIDRAARDEAVHKQIETLDAIRKSIE